MANNIPEVRAKSHHRELLKIFQKRLLKSKAELQIKFVNLNQIIRYVFWKLTQNSEPQTIWHFKKMVFAET